MNWSAQSFSALAVARDVTPEVRAVLADGEPTSLRHLRELLEVEPGVEVLAECGDAHATVEAVRAHRPNLLLLDAHLTGRHGLPVLSPIPVCDRPLVIFTGAHDSHAARAFEAQALDYLLKPLASQRLHAAIERTRIELLRAQDRNLTRKLLDFLTDAKPESPMDRRLVVKSEGRVVFVKMDEIDWIEAAANYVRLQSGSQSYLMREGISHIAARLDPNQFLRIHRSIIVNVQRIKELQPCNRGEYMVILTNGKELSCSRGYRARLQQLIAGA